MCRSTHDERPFRGSDALQAVDRPLEQRAVAEQGQEEFGVRRSTQRPETGPGSSGWHDGPEITAMAHASACHVGLDYGWERHFDLLCIANRAGGERECHEPRP